jgi:hypothetical protein
MKVKVGYFACTAAVAFGQNGSGVIPQVRWKISGNSSIAMSQRTPSHFPAMLISSSSRAVCRSGLA